MFVITVLDRDDNYITLRGLHDRLDAPFSCGTLPTPRSKAFRSDAVPSSSRPTLQFTFLQLAGSSGGCKQTIEIRRAARQKLPAVPSGNRAMRLTGSFYAIPLGERRPSGNQFAQRAVDHRAESP